MPVGNTSLPSFTSGITSPENWLNFILDLLSYSSIHLPAERITTQPITIIPGKLYLVGSGATFATPGTIAVYLTPAPTSILGIIPNDGTVVDGFVKTSTDWVNSEFVQGATVILTPTSSTVYNVPASFDGVCTVVNNSASFITIVQAGGRTQQGLLLNTPLGAGVYTLFQNATTAVIS